MYFCKVISEMNGNRDVAQLASALAWGARGRKFESSYPDKRTGAIRFFFLFIFAVS